MLTVTRRTGAESGPVAVAIETSSYPARSIHCRASSTPMNRDVSDDTMSTV